MHREKMSWQEVFAIEVGQQENPECSFNVDRDKTLLYTLKYLDIISEQTKGGD
jgi:hypothetical protein